MDFTVPVVPDDEGDTVTLSAKYDGAALPAWLSFDPVARKFSGIPPNSDAATSPHTITLVADDFEQATKDFSFTVIFNDAPEIPVLTD